MRGKADLPGDRADIDDAARPARVHFGQHRLDQFQHGEIVHFHHCPRRSQARHPRPARHCPRPALLTSPSIWPKRARVAATAAAISAGLVTSSRRARRAVGMRGDQRLQHFGPARGRHDIVAAFQQHFGHGAAKAAGAAGDQPGSGALAVISFSRSRACAAYRFQSGQQQCDQCSDANAAPECRGIGPGGCRGRGSSGTARRPRQARSG